MNISYNIDIRRELAKNPFCRVARISHGDGINLRTVTTTVYPSLYFTNEDRARQDAERLNVECVRIVLAHEMNGEISFSFMGWGLFDDDKLLETSDLVWV